MNRLATRPIRWRQALDSSWLGSASVVPLVDALLILAFVIDLVTPFFVWKGFLPASMSWLSHGAVLAAASFAYAYMMVSGQLAGAVWPLIGISMIGVTVALSRGQGAAPTLWGWWGLVKFPLVGLYAYVRPNWSEQFPKRLTGVCLAILLIETVFQLGQYLAGQEIGDSLAGTFGSFGVGPLLFFVVFCVCLALGEWLAQRHWQPLFWTLLLGGVSSVLAENKLFPFAALLLALIAGMLYLLHGTQRSRLLVALVLLAGGLWAFLAGYNAFVPSARNLTLEEYFLDEEVRASYLTRVRRSSVGEQVSYSAGRLGMLDYAIRSISEDGVTLAFGYGMGARGESKSLGVSGSVLQSDTFSRGADLVAMVQEMGVFGLGAILVSTLWVSLTLYRDAKRDPQSVAASLRYALLLFSLLWPLWLWYKKPLGSRVAMWLYWVALGYVLAEGRRQLQDVWSRTWRSQSLR